MAMKSHSGAKKRFFKSAKGLWRHQRPCRSHLLTPTTADRRLALGKKITLTKTQGKILSRFLPYA